MGLVDREKSRDSVANQEHASQMMSSKAKEKELASDVIVGSGPEILSNVEPKLSETPKVTEQEPKKKGRPVVKRETKKRYTLTFLPSVYDKASEKASEEGKSLSEVLGEFLSEYIKH